MESFKGAFAWRSLRRKWGVVLNVFSGKTIWVIGLGFHKFSSRILPQPRIDLRISTLRIRLLPRNIVTRSGFEQGYDLSIGLCRSYFRFGFVLFCKVMMLNINIHGIHKNLKLQSSWLLHLPCKLSTWRCLLKTKPKAMFFLIASITSSRHARHALSWL